MKKITLLLTLMLLTLGIGNAWAETVTLDNLGAGISSTSNTTVSTTTVNGYTLNYLQGKKQGNSILLAKGSNGGSSFISNKTPIPGAIKSVTVYINSGASGSATYHCAFSITECTSRYVTGSTAVKIAGGSSNKYTCSVENASYFCVALGANYNGQVLKLVVEYTPGSSDSSEPTISANPTDIDFGNVVLGSDVESKTVAVEFKNLAGAVTYSGLSTPFTASGSVSNSGDEITIAANASTLGEYTQTLTIASVDDDKSVDVTVKMNVVEPTGTFTRHTGDLIEGDYVIVDGTNAMNNTVTSNRLQYNAVMISNNEIVDPLAATIWHIAPNGEYWTIYSAAAEKYAASTSAKNQATLAASVSDNTKWTVTMSGNTFDFENLARSNGSDPGNKYLRKNGSYGFACYAGSTGGALSLYRKAGAKYNVNVNPTTNGTVTADPTSAEAGTTITLTVTPNDGYVLEALAVTSSEGNVTVTANTFTMPASDVEVTANFKEVSGTTQTLSGKFSTGEYEYAEFATGNLQYRKNDGNDEWRFAKQQYQVVGEDNIYVGKSDYAGWIDMFGWSNGDANDFGVNPSNDNQYYTGAFVDWGIKMGEEWSTLSKDQWDYLLNTRTNASSLKQIAMVDTMLGIMLFPDNWTLPEGCEPVNTLNHDPADGADTKYDFYTQNYTLVQWIELEKAGAVFLPAAGRRTGGWGNTTVSPHIVGTGEDKMDEDGHYKFQDNTNYHAYYWTSSYNESNETVTCLHNIKFFGVNDGTVGQASMANEQGRYGQSVRLAKVTSTSCNVTVVAENGTATGAGTYNNGDEVTLTATPDFDYEFVNWTVGGEVVSTANPYIFQATADVEFVANFKEVSGTTQALSGKFSTGKYEYAEFATGNLQYRKNDGNDEWRFAKQQYQVVGEDNIYVGKSDYAGWIDMFGWSNGDANDFGVNPSNDNQYYTGAFVDWGIKMGEEWSTLSKDQWDYLLNTRTNASSLKQIAMVDTMLGIMLFPDNWTLPEGCEPVNTLNHDPADGADTKYDFYTQNYTLVQWIELEKAGAVFLPAAGRRTGGWGNTTVSPHIVGTGEDKMDEDGHYKFQDNTNYHAYYWTSSYNESNETVTCLHNIKFFGVNDGTVGQASMANEQGRYGQSVRLAKVTGNNITTGLENVFNSENTTIKVIENNQLIIIRNGEKFNAQGMRF